MKTLSITVSIGFVMLPFSAVPAWGQQTVQRQTAPAPVIQQAPAARTVRVESAAPLLSKRELSHVVQQSQPPAGLTKDETEALQRVSERLRHKNRAVAEKEWASLVQRVAHRNNQVDVDALVNYVLRESYLESNRELKQYADKVRMHNEQKKALREKIKELRRQKQQLEKSNDPTRTVSVRSLTLSDNYDDRGRVIREAPPVQMTVDSVAEELQRIVVLANSADDDAELANVELQNALQKQQQTLQMMSNVSKMLHDTANSVIRNMR